MNTSKIITARITLAVALMGLFAVAGFIFLVCPPPALAAGKPSAPQNLAGGASGEGIVLTWDAPKRGPVTGYQVLRRRPGEKGTWGLVSNTGSAETTYTDGDVKNGVKYIYKVAAVNANGVGKRSNRLSIRMNLAAPRNLAGAVSGEDIVLTWDAPEHGPVTGYQVLRRRPDLGEGEYQALVVDTRSTETTYTDGNVENGVKYLYKVAAVNSRGAGNRSKRIRITMEEQEEIAQESIAIVYFCTPTSGKCDLGRPVYLLAGVQNATLDDAADTLDYVVRIDMLNSNGDDANACEGTGMGTDHEYTTVESATFDAEGEVNAIDCSGGSYTVRAVLWSGGGAQLSAVEIRLTLHKPE